VAGQLEKPLITTPCHRNSNARNSVLKIKWEFSSTVFFLLKKAFHRPSAGLIVMSGKEINRKKKKMVENRKNCT